MIKIPNYHKEHDSTLTQETVRTENIHFHERTLLKFGFYQNGCEIRHTYYILIIYLLYTYYILII